MKFDSSTVNITLLMDDESQFTSDKYDKSDQINK